MKRLALFSMFLVVHYVPCWASSSASQPVSFTVDDRDRIMRTEIKQDEMIKRFEDRFEQVDKRFEQMDKRFEQMDKRFEQMDKRFEQMESKYQWQFGILISAMFGLFGFILWDRRTFLKPFQQKVEEAESIIKSEKIKMDNILSALKELSKTDSKVAQVLKQYNLL